jgi:chromosome segregation ATPase
MSTPDENEPLLPAPENVDPTDSGAVAQVIKASATKAMAALAEIRTRVEGFDNQFQATERALAVIQPMIEQANQAFQDISDAAAKVLTDLQQSQLVEVPVRALSLALARANATLEAIVTLAKQYDAKLKLTESLVAAIAPHHRRVHAAITDASSYATAAAEAATSQLRGVHAVIAEQGLSSAATTMMAQLIASQAQALEERFHITENVSALAQQATSKAGQIAAKHEVHDKMVAASSVTP